MVNVRLNRARRAFTVNGIAARGAHRTIAQWWKCGTRVSTARGGWRDQNNFKCGKGVAADLQKWVRSPAQLDALKPTARAIVAKCMALGWRPVGAEVPCTDRGIATAVDLIVRDSYGRLNLIEVKCVAQIRWNSSAPGAFIDESATGGAQIPASPFNEACCQLALTSLLYKRTNPTANIGIMVVCHVYPNSSGGGMSCEMHEMPTWVEHAITNARQRLDAPVQRRRRYVAGQRRSSQTAIARTSQ